jgi:hypothetical protein
MCEVLGCENALSVSTIGSGLARGKLRVITITSERLPSPRAGLVAALLTLENKGGLVPTVDHVGRKLLGSENSTYRSPGFAPDRAYAQVCRYLNRAHDVWGEFRPNFRNSYNFCKFAYALLGGQFNKATHRARVRGS